MSVLIVTSLGDIVVDLHTDRCPLTSKNFLKLCKIKYYNGCLFHKVEKDFLAQTGDPTGTGTGGYSVYKYLYGDQARFFDDELHPELKHKRIGTIAMASAGKNLNASQFYFTLRDDLDYLDGKHTVFGIVEEKEGLETLAKINEAYVDDNGRPYKNIRIKHTYILDDPFSDPAELHEFIPEKSPEGKPNDEVAPERLEDNWVPLDENLGPAELEELIRSREAQTNAAILESIGDIPDADIKPPENVLFVCKLNPVTQDEDLHTIFSRFGNVTSADIIRDYKTGDSLCYAFIEFETKEACEFAYDKMANVLIDDRRIHVDFSQSVSKLWSQYRHGKRKESKGSGCFKCGASDHIARDCPQDSKNKDIAPKYVLKEDNRQRGGGSQSYDMVFDEDDESSKSAPSTRGNETGHVPKRQKIEGMLHTKDSEQKESDKSYKYNRDYEGRGHRETDSRRERPSNEYYREKASRSRDHRDRDDDEHIRNPNLRRYQDTSSRHGRDEASGGKRSRNDAEMGVDRRDASGAHNSRSEEDKSGYPNSSKDRDGGTSRDLHSKESRREKYDDRKGGREHHESSRHRRDNERNRSSGLGRSDYHQRESKDKDGKRR